jgi:hypothetical protein
VFDGSAMEELGEAVETISVAARKLKQRPRDFHRHERRESKGLPLTD